MIRLSTVSFEPFSFFTQLVGDREGIRPVEIPVSTIPKMFCSSLLWRKSGKQPVEHDTSVQG